MRYKEYKKVDMPWIEEIPSHWEVSRIKKIFYIFKDITYKENPVVLSLARDKVKIRNIENNQGQLASSYNNYNTVKIGDLLLNPMDLYSGANCNISYYNGVISPAYINLRTREYVCIKYFDYLFKLQYTSLAFQSVGKGVSKDNRWTLSNDTLLNYQIIAPPKEEQEQIARFLDWKINEIDRLIKLEKQKLNNLEINFKRRINDIFNSIDGNQVKLKYLFNFGKGLNITKEDLSKEGIKCISYGEIHGESRFSFLSSDKNLKCLGDHVKLNGFAQLDQGDFVFCDTSEDLEGSGNFSYKKDSGLVYASYHTIVAKPRVNFNSEYIAYFFESDLWRAQIRANVKGIKVYSITQLILKDSYIILPDIYTQKKIVKNLNDFKGKKINLTNNISVIIKKLESLKQSLISNVVTGKIDVRNVDIPNYEKVNDIEGAEILEENFEEEV